MRASAYTGGRYTVLEHIRLVAMGRIVCHQPSMSTGPLSTAACERPTSFRKVVVATSALAHRFNDSDIKRRRLLALSSGKTKHKVPTSHLDRITGGRARLIYGYRPPTLACRQFVQPAKWVVVGCCSARVGSLQERWHTLTA